MNLETNKKIVRVVLDDLTRETTYRCFADESSFEGHMVDYETSPIRKESAEQREARQHDARSEMRRAGKALLHVYPDGNTRAIKSITAEGDRVIAEYLVHAGRTVFDLDVEHNFHVVKVFELSRGEVVRMREYCDSAYLNVHAGPIAEFMHQAKLDDGDVPPAHSAWSSDWCLSGPEVRLESDAITRDVGWLAANKEIALALSGSWGDESMAEYLHEDVFFNNEVDIAVSPLLGKGIRGRDRLTAAAGRATAAFEGTLTRTVRAVTAENNRVVVEEELHGTSRLRPDIPFTTRQAKVCLLRDGRVFRIRQYLDSGFVQAYSPELVAHVFEGTELAAR
ncbi:nuclear transport factor 2 family protein [Umezawaea endophytica]|uniref:Nuclear transport factor 2 family protein n=1 Tax=Umezawaea endophytica TaxID=1654476 RepID=A0A9X2VU11_9PSEU|nr:nuclear transport factor 2 family protein [Umezawaea endophytica]MCS7482931.1 nuclear transport factor 2 family protein [Umezawaea endophytica]